MEYFHTRPQAMAYCDRALALMGEKEIAPHPNNYTVWYNYYSANFPDLNHALDIMLQGGADFTDEQNADIFGKFCAKPQDAVPLTIMAERMEAELTAVLAVLEEGGRRHAAYGQALEAATEVMAETRTPEQIVRLISNLLTATRSVVGQSREMERRLHNSAASITQLKEELAGARRQALTDPLTGLANRTMFDMALSQAMSETEAGDDSLSLLFIDVDHFKGFNERYGHQIGDQVLKLLSFVIQNNIKGKDTAARYGGEEFVVILPQTPLPGGIQVGKTICKQVAGRAIVNRASGERLGQVTISVGVAQFSRGESSVHFIERADRALRIAKSQGRNRVVADTNSDGGSATHERRQAAGR